MTALRKALGDTSSDKRYIVTLPGNGYRFIADLDSNGNTEFIVESHEYERIVVDQIEMVDDDATIAKSSLSSMGMHRRHLLWFGTAAGLVVAVLGWVAYSNRNAVDTRPSLQPATSRFATSGIPQRVAISDDGRTLAY